MDTTQVSPDAVRPCRWGRDRWALVLLLLLAWVLRLPPILDNRFHADEALYGYWGLLIGRGQDPWLATAPVYKPPLLPYLVAGAQALCGNSEFTVRLPGLAAGLLMVPLVAALAHALYRDRWTAVAAAVVVALSPFAILFSATAFTDPPMVALGLAACVAAARGRPGWAGLLAGLSLATKQTGLVWLPLVTLIQISNLKSQVPRLSRSNFARPGSGDPGQKRGFDNPLRAILNPLRLILCFSLVLGLVFAWDAARVAQGAESFWRMGVTGYGGLRLIWPQELWPRLRGWSGLVRYFFVSPVVNGALMVGLPALARNALTRRHRTRASFADLLLISFSLIYPLLHWLWAFPIWDRYLLPLLPILAILLGRLFSLLASHVQQLSILHSPFSILHSLLFILLVLPAWNAAHSRYPVGGDHGAYDGIDKVAAFLSHLPEGSVVYQHWLGWHYQYYLFDAPVYLAYWPRPSTWPTGPPRPGWRGTCRLSAPKNRATSPSHPGNRRRERSGHWPAWATS